MNWQLVQDVTGLIDYWNIVKPLHFTGLWWLCYVMLQPYFKRYEIHPPQALLVSADHP